MSSTGTMKRLFRNALLNRDSAAPKSLCAPSDQSVSDAHENPVGKPHGRQLLPPHFLRWKQPPAEFQTMFSKWLACG